MTSIVLFETIDSSEKKSYDLCRYWTRILTIASLKRWPLGHPALISCKLLEIDTRNECHKMKMDGIVWCLIMGAWKLFDIVVYCCG